MGLAAETSGNGGLEGVRLEFIQSNELQRGNVCRFEDDLGGLIRLVGFFPPCDAKTPAITRLQAGKTPFGFGSAQVVSAHFGKGEEFIGHHRADQMQSDIPWPGIATTCPKKTGHRLGGTALHGLSENIFGASCGDGGHWNLPLCKVEQGPNSWTIFFP